MACESLFGHVWTGNPHREGSLWPYLYPRVLPILHRTPRQEAKRIFSVKPCKNYQQGGSPYLNLDSCQPAPSPFSPNSGHRDGSPRLILSRGSTGLWVLPATSRGGYQSRRAHPKAATCMSSLALAAEVHPQDMDLTHPGA